MSSLVIYSNEFPGHLENGLGMRQFKYRLLAEGDSWMDRSAMFDTSLLQALARRLDAMGHSVLIVNLAVFGDTMRRIGSYAGGDFRQWLQTDFPWTFDAVLLSAGGNDYIDAARDPGPGQGILHDMRHVPPPTDAAQCIDLAAIAQLDAQYLNPNFDALYAVLQGSRHAGIPLLLNQYDVPAARHAPAFPGGRAWLSEAYERNGISQALWPDVTRQVFKRLAGTIDGWAAGRPNCHVVKTQGTLVPADPGTSGSDHDWLNEIHPNAQGWDKLASLWASDLLAVLGQP